MPHALLDADLGVENDRLNAFRWALAGVRETMQLVKTSPQTEFINPYLLLDALVHTKRDLEMFKGPDEFKTGGHLCFWIARLKPFRAFLKEMPFYSNEVMALRIGLSIVHESQGKRQIPYDVLANLFYELRYGFTSPLTITNQFQLLYCK